MSSRLSADESWAIPGESTTSVEAPFGRTSVLSDLSINALTKARCRRPREMSLSPGWCGTLMNRVAVAPSKWLAPLRPLPKPGAGNSCLSDVGALRMVHEADVCRAGANRK